MLIKTEQKKYVYESHKNFLFKSKNKKKEDFFMKNPFINLLNWQDNSKFQKYVPKQT